MPYVEVWVDDADCGCPDSSVLKVAVKLLKQFARETPSDAVQDECLATIDKIVRATGKDLTPLTPADQSYVAWKASKQEGSRA